MTAGDLSEKELLWSEGLPEKELYDIYASTVETRFPAFGIRDYEEARYDMGQPFHSYDDSGAISQDILDLLLTRQSHDRYTEQLDEYITKHGLRGWLEYGGSLVFVSDHGQFTDVPINAETIGRIGLGERERTVQVISEMIATMTLDLGKGEEPVLKPLRHVSALAQTVPRLEGDPSNLLQDYREVKNSAGVSVMENVKNTEGSISVLSIVGRHNKPSRRGGTLYIHEPNQRTLETYTGDQVKAIPVYMHCPTFDEDGNMTPANMEFELFPPVQNVEAKKDTKKIVEMFRTATQRVVGGNYRHGVKIRSWKAQQAKRRALHIGQSVIHSTDADSTLTTDEY